MKLLLAALAMLLLQAPAAGTSTEADVAPPSFQFQRSLTVPAGSSGQACFALPPELYARTEGRLSALRIYKAGPSRSEPPQEVPFALTESGEAGQQEEPAHLQNLGSMGGVIVFDLAMPQRTYTSVELSLAGQNFLGSAHVYGLTAQAAAAPRFEISVPMPANARPTPPAGAVDLGTFALYDLSSQGLSRSTTLPLQEVTFPMLHVELTLHPAPGTPAPANGYSPDLVTGASVPPSRLAQTLYTTVAATSIFSAGTGAHAHQTLASIHIPAHIPVERTVVSLAPGFTKNFSRSVEITAFSGTHPPAQDTQDLRAQPTPVESLYGEISRVTLPAGPFNDPIHAERLAVETLLSSNLRSDATVQFAIENHDDAPLPLAAIALQMRERKLCMDVDPAQSPGDSTAGPTTYTLLYGSPNSVRAPIYDYARLFHPSPAQVAVTLGPEVLNPTFIPSPHASSTRSYTDRHPELLWIALLAAVSILGTIAIRTAKSASKPGPRH